MAASCQIFETQPVAAVIAFLRLLVELLLGDAGDDEDGTDDVGARARPRRRLAAAEATRGAARPDRLARK